MKYEISYTAQNIKKQYLFHNAFCKVSNLLFSSTRFVPSFSMAASCSSSVQGFAVEKNPQ